MLARKTVSPFAAGAPPSPAGETPRAVPRFTGGAQPGCGVEPSAPQPAFFRAQARDAVLADLRAAAVPLQVGLGAIFKVKVSKAMEAEIKHFALRHNIRHEAEALRQLLAAGLEVNRAKGRS